ncbi:MAG: phosphatase PAP2 family protein, partial [Candidatus Latescibacteria bacterium]|nr:phosphatase PAP2 family protein [Candidatus Latescibacterota bacterium]
MSIGAPGVRMTLGARLKRAIFALRPEEFATLLFFVPTGFALAQMSLTRVDAPGGPAAAYPGSLARLILLVAATALFVWLVRSKPRWTVLRDSMPFLFAANIYASLHDLIRFFHAPDITGALYRWDVLLFGSEPTVWAERFAHPWLTDYFTVCYWLFYVLGPVMGLFLHLRNDRPAFRRTMVTVVFCLYLGYVGYVAWPASAPRLYIPGAYSVHLHGTAFLD